MSVKAEMSEKDKVIHQRMMEWRNKIQSRIDVKCSPNCPYGLQCNKIRPYLDDWDQMVQLRYTVERIYYDIEQETTAAAAAANQTK